MNDLDQLCNRVEDLISAVRELPPGERKRKRYARLLERGSDLDLANREFIILLEKQSDFLIANEGHPQYDEWEAKLLANIKRYERAFDLSDLVLDVMGEHSDGIRSARPGANTGLSGGV